MNRVFTRSNMVLILARRVLGGRGLFRSSVGLGKVGLGLGWENEGAISELEPPTGTTMGFLCLWEEGAE